MLPKKAALAVGTYHKVYDEGRQMGLGRKLFKPVQKHSRLPEKKNTLVLTSASVAKDHCSFGHTVSQSFTVAYSYAKKFQALVHLQTMSNFH